MWHSDNWTHVLELDPLIKISTRHNKKSANQPKALLLLFMV